MKKKLFAFFLIAALIISSFVTTGTAKELDSLAEIASLSKLEPIGSTSLNANTALAEVKASNLPASYSSRDLGHTTAVRQQSSNTCWAYSSLASLETLLLKNGERVEHFSTEHMNIWGSVESDGTGWQREDLVSDGGYSYIPMGYLTSWSGPLKDSELPVRAGKNDYTTANSLYSADYGVTGIKYVTQETPIETVKSYIMDYGAIVTNFNADTVKYMNSSSDAFYCPDSTISTSNLYGHAVSLVGWDDNYAKENFSSSASGATPSSDGAWLIKNSWGTYVNTNGGYFWISYEDAWIFHSIFGPSFAISDYVRFDGSEKLYQNEVYGATTQFPYLTDESIVPADEITYINVFDFEGDSSVLDKVVFESTSFDADYTVYYIPVQGGKPTRETRHWKKLATGTVDYTGYISVDVNGFELPKGKGAIGVCIDNTRTYNENKKNPDYEYIANSIGVCEWLAFSGGYYFKNQGEQGESFVMYEEFGENKLYDLMDFYDEYFDDTMGATFVIKAITVDPDYVPDPTEIQTIPTEASSSTVPSTQSNTISLGVTLEYIGNTRLNVIAKAKGGTGEYDYEFAVNGTVAQSYSSKNYASLEFDTDGIYTIQISVKDSGGRAMTTEAAVVMENGKLHSYDPATPSTSVDPTETTRSTTPAETTQVTNPTETSQFTNPTETTHTTAYTTITVSATTASTTPTTTVQNGTAYVMGDADLNGKLSIKDATSIQKYLAKIAEFDEIALALSDVDANGKCSIKDATCIQKYLAKIDSNSNAGNTVIISF